MSLIYVNSINWTVRLSIGDGGGLLWYGSLLMQSRSGFLVMSFNSKSMYVVLVTF